MGNYLPELTEKQRLVFSVLHGYAVPCRFQRIAWLRRAVSFSAYCMVTPCPWKGYGKHFFNGEVLRLNNCILNYILSL